ncbi:cob(I)yrinic acid a,c-diamide adenosyltransferase [Candidatus Woesearchaeota archaeon]|nr:cob(I)yrinic acid a,c-diamide adenosyltransferase [Candidatus Woesearchaeota archaeon]
MKKGLEGLVQVYTGNGKGKTTAAIGLGVRAAGHGYKVCMVQFLKPSTKYGEHKSLKKIKNFEVKSYGLKDFATHSNRRNYKRLSNDAFNYASKTVMSGKYDIVILDEVNFSAAYGYVKLEDVIRLIEQKPKSVELVLTGRDAPKEIMEKADLVTVMQEVKHPYKQGIKARKGIEY